jgi:hypothetical protein
MLGTTGNSWAAHNQQQAAKFSAVKDSIKSVLTKHIDSFERKPQAMDVETMKAEVIKTHGNSLARYSVDEAYLTFVVDALEQNEVLRYVEDDTKVFPGREFKSEEITLLF